MGALLIWQLAEGHSSYKIILGILIFLLIVAIWEFLRKRPDYPLRDIRFVFFIFILIPVQTLFAHAWLTVPYYLDRAFAGTFVGNYFEFFSNLNPILIFILAPLIASFTSHAKVYKMMIWGTLIMALPTFLLALGPNPALFLMYVLFMTIGEAMWQPRFLQWIAEIAPEGRTGAYMGIGQMPWFLTKLITSSYSGYFVANYIPQPETGLPLRTGEMWLIYAFIAMISPIALILARKWMMAGMKERAD
jgi:MFS family permease